MATEIKYSTPPGPRVNPRVRVYTRVLWIGAWELQPNLLVDSLVWTSNPDMATAQFTWHYGRIKRPDSAEWETVSPLDGLRLFVKVEVDRDEDDHASGLYTWYGILEEDNGEQRGVLALPAGGKAAGRQHLVGYGLDVMLSRHVLNRSRTLNAADNEQTVERAIEFNAKTNFSTPDRVETGNRTPDKGSNDAYVFAHDLATAEFWTTLDATEYLLAYQPPTDQVDSIAVPWKIDPVVLTFWDQLPNWDKPRVPVQGRTLRAVLDQLIDRRRLLGYTIDVEPTEEEFGLDTILLRPFTFTPEDLELDDNKIQANPDQYSLVFDRDTGLQTAMTRKASLQSVDQVVCQGDQAVACFTITSATAYKTLVAHWTAAQQTEYDAGATGTTGYGSLEVFQQVQRDAWARKRQRVKRVYSYFGLPDDWKGQIHPGDPEPGFFFPNDAGDGPLPIYLPGVRFLPKLPLKTDHDYTGTKIGDGTVVDNTPPGQKWEYLPMFAAISDPADGKFQFLDSLSQHTEVEVPSLGLQDGVPWSGFVRPQDDAPGFVITTNGAPQHVLAAGGDFVPLPTDEFAGRYNWKDELIATVAVNVDQFAEGLWPEDPAATEAVRRLVIDLGDEYQLHYVAEYTAVDVKADGDLETVTSPGFIRDDRPKLQALAKLVYEWYRTERQSIELGFGYITTRLRVGDLITTIGQGESLQTINSVVTTVKMEFGEQEPGGQPPASRTTITTQFAEFDARAFVRND